MKGLFIGRFQPLHVGHVAAIGDALHDGELIIGVGSSEKHHTRENPFTYDEREEMIRRSVKGDYAIRPIPDIGDYDTWVNHVETLVGDFDAVYTGNAVVSNLFSKEGYDVKPVKETLYVSASNIRDMMVYRQDWKPFVPEATAAYLDTIEGAERVRTLNRHYLNPAPAADIVIKYDGGIVLIKKPDGRIALPGGFVEFGETTEAAAVREAKEETGLDITLEGLLGVYSDPKRDSRTHVISITYVANGRGELRGGDDAAEAFVVPVDEAARLPLAYDHNEIIADFKRWLK